MTEDMNRNELALLLSLGMAAQQHAGQLAKAAGHTDANTADKVRAIAMHIEDTLTHVIVGLRQPGPTPTAEEIRETIHLAAAGAVVAILGEQPTPSVLH